ncbi:hypothetical protein [Actinoplanes sp. NPDC049118]|uniref:hypothetical protein n=1 Tax=Actinoplanes sp. NPDC049118 TaxID=3155769 RepID=UPI0034090325
MSRAHLLALLAGAALAAAGCSVAAHPGSGPTEPITITAGPSEVDSGNEDIGAAATAPPAAAAMLAVQTYIRLWARPSLARDVWYAGVRTWVTPAYAQLLADTDPAHVPAHDVTGPLLPVSSTTSVLVADVPTDAGLIRVTVVNTAGRWLVSDAEPAPAA